MTDRQMLRIAAFGMVSEVPGWLYGNDGLNQTLALARLSGRFRPGSRAQPYPGLPSMRARVSTGQ